MGEMRTQIPYPPCIMNPMTEKPYSRHQWEVPEGADAVIRKVGHELIYYYRVRCKRCGLNDPSPPLH